MRAAITKTEIEAEIASRFGSAFKPQEKRQGEFLSSGVSQIDSFTGGLPRGAITEIYGPASSGRTSFMLSAMAHATGHEEVCALVDTNNTFDPHSAARAEVRFDRLLWIRCANNLEHAFKATDMLLQAGGFGLVMLDLGDVPAKSVKKIITSWWYRFRRTLEATTTALVVIVEDSAVRSCAAVSLELHTENYLWRSSSEVARSSSPEFSVTKFNSSVTHLHPQSSRIAFPHANRLQGLAFQVECRRPLYLKREVGVVARS
ncbi:MAG TPA: hypothetical protein VJS64_06810 [Pyrinomonadaceae bacterium]|nr:hypothetical protein [Pyrinomonadaceae bacterium]